jgi:hypothetical protein
VCGFRLVGRGSESTPYVEKLVQTPLNILEDSGLNCVVAII